MSNSEIELVANTFILALLECKRITIDQSNRLMNRFSGLEEIKGSNDFLLNVLSEVSND